jgi:hypothetical protein
MLLESRGDTAAQNVSEKKLHYLPSLFLFVHVAVFVV